MQDDHKNQADKQLERLLMEGLEGEETLMTSQDWIDIRKEALELIRRRRKPERL